MTRRTGILVTAATVIFAAGFAAGGISDRIAVAHAQSTKVYELRTYTAPEGKLGDLHARFRNHTMRIFDKHGMKSVAYFSPQDAPARSRTSTTRERSRTAISRGTSTGSPMR